MMDRITLAEFALFLQEDPDLRILLVEGNRDLIFWRALVPELERSNVAIYKIGSLEINVDHGGERGRLIKCAEVFETHDNCDRVRIFADADASRILDQHLPDNVILTDGRDLESYGLSRECVHSICVTGFGMRVEVADNVWAGITPGLRPVGVLRVAAERQGWKLPFNRTFDRPGRDRGGLKRYLLQSGSTSTVDMRRLMQSLIQNADPVPVDPGGLAKEFEDETRRLEALPDNQIVHGKDFVSYLRWRLQCTYDQATAYLNLGMAVILDTIRDNTNLSLAERWVRTGN